MRELTSAQINRVRPKVPTTLARTAMVALLVYPWLHLPARGPSIAVEPLLVGWACLSICVLVLAWTQREWRTNAQWVVFVAGAVLVLLLSSVLQGTRALNPSVAGACMASLVMLAASLVSTSLADEGPVQIELIAWAWLLAALLSCIAAFAQFFGVDASLKGMVAPSVAHQAYANLRQKNLFSTLVAIGLCALVWLWGRHAHKHALALRAAGGVLCAGLAVSASRTGFVELFVLVILYACWHHTSTRALRWLGIAAIAYVAAASAFALWQTTGSGDVAPLLRRLWGDAPDCMGRRVLWSTIIGLVREHPWTGLGWGETPYAVFAFPHEPHFCAIVENAHNLPLHLAVELGLPVAILFIALSVLAIVRGRPLAEIDDARRLGWAVLAVLGVHSLLEYPLWYGPFEIAAGLAIGLTMRGRAQWNLPRAVPALLSAMVLIATAAAAFDYARVSQLFMAPQARWAR
jgi:O-antigen ligase